MSNQIKLKGAIEMTKQTITIESLEYGKTFDVIQNTWEGQDYHSELLLTCFSYEEAEEVAEDYMQDLELDGKVKHIVHY